jgi:pyridoxine 4-dehydrogenase
VAGCPPTHLSRCTSRCTTTSAASARRARRGQPPDRCRGRRPLGGSGHGHAQFEALAELQQQGLIRHLGLSTVSLDQLAEAQQIAPVVCVQNFYNIANRADEAVLAATADQHIAYVPYFPLGGFSPLHSDVLESVGKRLGARPRAVAESWLLQHSPNIMLIPGTSSVAHLRENIVGAGLTLPPDGVAELDAI